MSNPAVFAKRVAMLFGVTAALTLALGAPTIAVANNNADTWYSSYAMSHNVTKTAAREKQDYSKSWNDCRSVTDGVTHSVEVVANKDYETFFVGSPVYSWTQGQSGYLTNYVKENKYDWAQLWFNNHKDYGITISGYWSPDNRNGY